VGARFLGMEEVTGSTPVSSTMLKFKGETTRFLPFIFML